MLPETKAEILKKQIVKRLDGQYPQLKNRYDFDKIIKTLVLLAPKINVKVLLSNGDNIIIHFVRKADGSQRFKEETFAEFVQRKFKLNRQKQPSDGYSSDDDGSNDNAVQKVSQKRFEAFSMAEIMDPNFYNKQTSSGASCSSTNQTDSNDQKKLYCSDDDHLQSCSCLDDSNTKFADKVNSNPNSPYQSDDDNFGAVLVDSDSDSDANDSDDDQWQGANKGKTSSSSSTASIPEATNDSNTTFADKVNSINKENQKLKKQIERLKLQQKGKASTESFDAEPQILFDEQQSHCRIL